MSFIAALDVGTTSVRCYILDKNCQVRSSATERVELLNPQPGYFEIEPESLWQKIVRVCNQALTNAQLTPHDLSCMGISSQRCTFLTWNVKTKEYYHNFITWKDLRANKLVEEWNSGYALKTVNGFSYALYLLTRSNRFLAGSVIKMMNGQVTLRLLHEMQNNARLQEAVKQNVARIEFLDSWILYKLRSGNGRDPSVEHITDITSCTATGLFDPFTLSWSPLVKLVFGIDPTMLPKVVDNGYQHFGYIHPKALGNAWDETNIPITASMSDQSAAIWGSHCFDKGDVKITLGTGAFLNLITGKNCHASLSGMYPLVAWQILTPAFATKLKPREFTVYCVEGASHDMGTVIEWAQQCGFFNDPAETEAIATSVPDTGGVYFMPAFSGLGPPVNDHKAASGFIGITPSTTRAHMVRAILESIVFRVVQLCETVEQESKYELKLLKVDGGVSRNNFICQLLADATGIPVERAVNTECSVMGVLYMAGMNAGIWQNVENIRKFRQIERVFQPQRELCEDIRKRLELWSRAIERFGQWY